jgi:hypothetical protein
MLTENLLFGGGDPAGGRSRDTRQAAAVARERVFELAGGEEFRQFGARLLGRAGPRDVASRSNAIGKKPLTHHILARRRLSGTPPYAGSHLRNS